MSSDTSNDLFTLNIGELLNYYLQPTPTTFKSVLYCILYVREIFMDPLKKNVGVNSIVWVVTNKNETLSCLP